MKALVLGLGISGQSALKFLQSKGYEVIGVDDQLKPEEITDIKDFDLFIPSPGVAQTHPLYVQAKQHRIPIKGEAQLALEEIQQPCIGITGTNGKTTVVKMIAHCLNACGKKARAVGNIGEPLTQCVHLRDEILVVELSSYQLETLTANIFDMGMILNIEEDHLDRYATFQEYAAAKAQLQYCLNARGRLCIHKSVSKELFTTPYQVFEGHNEEAANLACAHFGIDRPSFFKALSSFEKPAHRLEFVGKIGSVSYFNDSKATNVAAVVNALHVIDTEVVLILGGLDKGLSFEPLCTWKKKLSGVVVFGQAREKIANALKHQLDIQVVETLQEAVSIAKKLVKANGTILFSPGCASFDAFKNYAERGEVFKRLLKE